MTSKVIVYLMMLMIFSAMGTSFAEGENVEAAIILAEKDLDNSFVSRIIKQNDEISESTKITTFTGPISIFLSDPDNMSMAMIARYDNENNTGYLNHKYTAVSGKTSGVEYIMIKLYSAKRE